MKKFSAKQIKWLKSFHLLFAGVWIACGSIMLIFSLLSDTLKSDDQLYMLNFLTDFIDMKILVPSAMLCLFTGLLYSVFTKWGFFKRKWLVFKWIITIGIIITGTVFTGPWIEEMVVLSKELGLGALGNARYASISTYQLVVGVCMNLTLIAAVFVSVFKPD